MITWNLDPVLLSIGPLEIRWYGLVYALGFLLGWYILRKAVKEKQIKNMTIKDAEDYIFLLILGSILMARIFHCFVFSPEYYLANPGQIIAIWNGGLSIHGGLLGAGLVSWWFCKKRNIRLWRLADIAILPLVLVYGFGRIVNYVNGELWGKITDVPWCVNFPGVEGCRHPSQIYQAIGAFITFTILVILRETKKLREGVLFWGFILLNGIFRFFITIFRAPDYGEFVFLGITTGRWLSLLMIVIAVYWFTKKRWKIYD